MKINYIGYQENILEAAINENKARVYVFDNFQNLREAKKYYHKPFLKKESLFITMADLKERLFPSGRMMLKEEKLAIFFYELLSDEEKDRLGIENYFDSIDLSANFFKFYRELNEYKIKDIGTLRDWQQEKYEIFQAVRERYCKKMDEMNYIDSTLAFTNRFFDDYYFREYQEISFVNIINFTPREKDLIHKLEESAYELELFLQLEKGDFDEANLKLSSVSLPDTPETEINLYKTDEEFLQLINLLQMIKEKDISLQAVILDVDFPNSNYEKLLSKEKVNIEREISFTETGLYKYLENLYMLIISADIGREEVKLEIKSLLEACYQVKFRDYYNLSISDLKSLQEIAAADYIYLSVDLIDRVEGKFTGFKRIFQDINKILNIKDLSQFVDFLERIDLYKLNDRYFSNNISQYFDGLLEISSIEEMGIVSSWNKYFPNKALGLFRLILNYLRYKQLKGIFTKESTEAGISANLADLRTAAHLNQEKLYIFNASTGLIPAESSNGFLLTEKQRNSLGLKTIDLLRLEEKYYFFRHIFSSKNTVIISRENLEENISCSPFVDELILAYGLDIKELPVKAEHYPHINKSIFKDKGRYFNTGLNIDTKKEDRLRQEKEDFQGNFSLSYYKYGVLKDCYYKFFLEHIAGLEEERLEISKELSPRFLGILVHELFADLLEEIDSDFIIDEKRVKELLEYKLRSNYLKINSYYLKYYQEILFPEIKDSIISFFSSIIKRIDGQIIDVFTEWKPEGVSQKSFYQNQITNIYLNGRIDLLINTDKTKYLIDFKTGSGDAKQLDFYSLLLNPDFSEDFNIGKAIYAVLDKKYDIAKKGTENTFAEELKKTLREFFEHEDYFYEYKPSLCNRCKMIDICRVV